MASPEQVGQKLTDTLIYFMPERLRAPLTATVSEGCEILADNEKFLFLAQEFVNNCAEKENDTPVEVKVVVTFDEPADMFHMTVEDNVFYPPNEARHIIKSLNSSKPERTGKKRVETTGDDEWMWLPVGRQILEGWGGALVYRESEDHRIVAEATWTKQGLLTAEPVVVYP
jgi:hypothetical protein